MSTSNSLRRAVRYALLTSVAAGASVPAFAAEDQTIQEVVVTGSRIAQPNLETTSPVTQVTAEDVVTQGVTKETLKPGDRVIITGSPARDPAAYRVHLKKIQRPADGWEWVAARR